MAKLTSMDINAGLGLGSGGLGVGFGLENGLTRSYITSAVCCARGCWFAVYLLGQLRLASLRGRLIEYQLRLGVRAGMSPLPGGR